MSFLERVVNAGMSILMPFVQGEVVFYDSDNPDLATDRLMQLDWVRLFLGYTVAVRDQPQRVCLADITETRVGAVRFGSLCVPFMRLVSAEAVSFRFRGLGPSHVSAICDAFRGRCLACISFGDVGDNEMMRKACDALAEGRLHARCVHGFICRDGDDRLLKVVMSKTATVERIEVAYDSDYFYQTRDVRLAMLTSWMSVVYVNANRMLFVCRCEWRAHILILLQSKLQRNKNAIGRIPTDLFRVLRKFFPIVTTRVRYDFAYN